MAARKKKRAKKRAKKKRKTKRSRTGSAQSGVRAAWKRAETRLANYFGTTRKGIGFKGMDSAEAPTIHGWLELRAPDFLKDTEPFSHIGLESKCDKQILSTLERWHDHVLTNPLPKYLKPLAVYADDELPYHGGATILLCLLEDLPWVYRALFGWKPDHMANYQFLQVLQRFWIGRIARSPTKFVRETFQQLEDSIVYWKQQQASDVGVTRVFEVVYFSYPKHVKPACALRFPAPWHR